MYGVELAITVCNLSRQHAEIFHVKTKPHMAIRAAVRMSMSIPVLMEPCQVSSAKGGAFRPEDAELFVDGGVLMNYPIELFDGWWLSMDPQDAFFHRMGGPTARQAFSERFAATNPK